MTKRMTRGYVTPGEAGLIVFITGSVIGTALITTLFFLLNTITVRKQTFGT